MLPSLKSSLAAVRWRLVLLAVAVVIATVIAAAWLHGWYTRPAPLSPATYTAAVPERQVADVPKAAVAVKTVQAYDKTKLLKKLPALAPELAPEGRQAIANARIPASRGGASAVAIIDTATGAGEIVVKEIPPPLVQFEGDGAVGLRYGITSDLRKEGTLYGRVNVLRIGNLHLGAYAEVNTAAEAKAQASLEYRW